MRGLLIAAVIAVPVAGHAQDAGVEDETVEQLVDRVAKAEAEGSEEEPDDSASFSVNEHYDRFSDMTMHSFLAATATDMTMTIGYFERGGVMLVDRSTSAIMWVHIDGIDARAVWDARQVRAIINGKRRAFRIVDRDTEVLEDKASFTLMLNKSKLRTLLRAKTIEIEVAGYEGLMLPDAIKGMKEFAKDMPRKTRRMK